MTKKKTTYINLVIDGKPVKVSGGQTVLEAAREAGIYIPTLCHLDNLIPYGGCRLCMVEIEKMRGFPTACTTPAAGGMVVKTKTPQIQQLRREILAFTLSEHPYTCLVCKENNECPEYMYSTRKVNRTTGCNFCSSNGDCELQDLVDYLEIREIDYPIDYRGLPVIKDNPFYEIDYNLCILCGRCVRICNEERNSGVLAFVQRGKSTLVGTAFDESQKDAGCEFCGACVDVCPTGSLSEKMGRWVNPPDKSAETTCLFCGEGCTMNINTRGNRIINVGPPPGGRTNTIQLCVRGKFIPGDIVHHPDRIKTPMIQRNGNWIEVSWEEALSFTAASLEKYRGNQFGMIGSAMTSMEENYILQKFARKVMRSNNNDIYNAYSNRNLLSTICRYQLINPPAEIDRITGSDTLLLIETDAYETHPMVENRIRKASRMGATIILLHPDPNRTKGFATHHLKYKAGLLGNVLELVLDGMKKSPHSKTGSGTSPKKQVGEKKIRETGLSKADLESVIRLIRKAGKLTIVAGERMLRGSDSHQTLEMLISLEKTLGKEKSSGTLFLLDEGNRYGSTFAGMHPDLLPGFMSLSDPENRAKWSGNWGVVLSEIRGLTYREMAENIREDGITALYVTGDIPLHPGLEKLKFMIQQNLFLTETSKFANVFLPVLTFTELSGHVMTLDRKLKELKRIIEPEEGLVTVPQIIASISRRMQETGFEYAEPEEIFSEIQSFTDLSFARPDTADRLHIGIEDTITGLEDSSFSLNGSGREKYRYIGNPATLYISDFKAILDD